MLYMQRATFGVMGAALFFQVSAAVVLLALWADGTPIHEYLVVHMAPAVTSTVTLIVYRSYLPVIWDAHLKIRPLVSFDPLNDTLSGQLKQLWRVFFPKEEDVEDSDDEEEEFFDPYAGIDMGDMEDDELDVGEDGFADEEARPETEEGGEVEMIEKLEEPEEDVKAEKDRGEGDSDSERSSKHDDDDDSD